MWSSLVALILGSSSRLIGPQQPQTPYDATGIYVGPDVPVGEPVQGDYTGKWRPQVHFSPPKGFLNDPNGLFRADNGTWHLYYQLNPTGLTGDFQHWGHVTSEDLYHWVNQPIALFPTDNHTYVWSGCAVVDTNNTSGFFPNQTDGVIAMYSLHNDVKEVQAIAYSRDGGYTFTPYEGNPVLDINSDSFHDVGLTRYGDKWILTVSYVRAFTIGIFVSDNMIDWTPTSNISYVGVLGPNGYQCPNLKELPIKGETSTQWVLSMAANPGAPNGGSVDFFIPGDFNGTHFEPLDHVTRFMDFAEDNYASQFFANMPVDETYSIAWASNWAYTNDVPTDREGWRGAMSLPRRNQLTKVEPWGWQLASVPADLSPVMDQELKSGSIVNNSWDIDLSSVPSGAIYLDVNISLPSHASVYPSNAWLNFSFYNGNDEELIGRYAFSGSNTAYLDRTKTYGYDSPAFVNKWSMTQFKPAYRLQAVFDRSILEMFLDDGDFSGTMIAFPNEPLSRLKLKNSNMPEGTTTEAAVWGLKSVWS